MDSSLNGLQLYRDHLNGRARGAWVAETKMVLPNGTQITVSGTPDEVAGVLKKLTAIDAGLGTQEPPPKSKARAQRPASISGRILALRDDGFFNEVRSLGDVQGALKAKGHIYPVTTLSPTVLALVRKSELRRLKAKSGRWAYVRP